MTIKLQKLLIRKNSKLKMKNDQNQLLVNALATQKISKSRRSSYVAMNRVQKIRDKRMIYPESTLNKIVLISNIEGSGFQRQNLYSYDIPAHIEMQTMINGINKVCFNQWRNSFEALQEQPLSRYDNFQKAITVLAILVITIFIFFMINQSIPQTKYLAYIFVALIVLTCVCSFFLMRQKRTEVNKDRDMVKAIKKQLIRLNQAEVIQYSDAARFTWSCHKQCLWIACQFH